jgi:hypothetical protein
MKNYSTFDGNNFFIKKNSTLPELKYPLTQWLRERYDLTDSMLENVAVTFSMTDADTGVYHIANVPANLVINRQRPEYPDEVEYTLMYHFKLSQTKKPGRYLGEFKIDFLGDGQCGKLTLPTEEKIKIIISDSITKTTVV